MRLLQAGISTDRICGVRDAAAVWEVALERRGVTATTAWCDLATGQSLSSSFARVGAWLDDVSRSVVVDRIDWIVLHYSVFAYGRRGVPVFAPRVMRRLAAAGVPVAALLHEYAYPLGRRGWRGTVQALSHRVVLPWVVGGSEALVVTTEQRAAALRRSRLLPRRPVVFIPVFSNLPEVAGEPRTTSFSLGVVGFGSPGADPELLATALRRLTRTGRTDVVLLGSPGPHGAVGTSWERAFTRHGIGSSLTFGGVAPAAVLARQIAERDLVLFLDGGGPESRRGTLAAALAAARPVLALDGPARWDALVRARAVAVSPPEPEALARRIAELRSASEARSAQGQRARAFYESAMAPEVAADTLRSFLDRLGPHGRKAADRTEASRADSDREDAAAPEADAARLA